MKPNTPLLAFVKDLVNKQFPEYQGLDIRPIETQGHDHHTFHLGDRLLLRMPTAAGYAPQILKEAAWLPFLKNHLSITIPGPLHLGKPTKDYPWHWSISIFIPGKSLNKLTLSAHQKSDLASDLAHFLKALHKAPTSGAPLGGSHNYYRGCGLAVYDTELKQALLALTHVCDTSRILTIWEKALQSTWQKPPVWVHGDLSPGNLLLLDGKLNAVIDFGCMAIGDPACDLVMAWTFFDDPSRKLFQETVNLDPHTWTRAQAWTLWKACIQLSELKDLSSATAQTHQHIIQKILQTS